MNKILITGASGFIGSHLMNHIKDNKIAEVYGIDILDNSNIFSHEPIQGIDTIFHLAGQTSVGESIVNPFFDATMNIMATIHLIGLYPKAKIIFAGSVASKDIQSPYGLSKKTAGEYIKLMAKEWAICNFPNVYGEGSKGVIDTWLKSDEIIINGKGYQTRTFVHVSDICKGLLRAVNWYNQEFDLGSGEESNILNIAEAISKKTGKKINYVEGKEGEIMKSLVLNTTPNWTPKISVYDYINNK